MAVSTIEGIVENGCIRLRDNVMLPDNTKVYVVVPDIETPPQARVCSPHLAHREQAADFVKHVVEVSDDAGL